jgi:hypothetical protein
MLFWVAQPLDFGILLRHSQFSFSETSLRTHLCEEMHPNLAHRNGEIILLTWSGTALEINLPLFA